MNSIAQHAVPNGNGQNEVREPQSSSASKVVVIQLSPVILSMELPLSPGISLPLVTGGHKLEEVLSLPWVTRAARPFPAAGPDAPDGLSHGCQRPGGWGDSRDSP